jgi:hypothetical protein
MDDELLCLTFCTTTETNRVDEAPYIAGCIMNRVRAGYRGKSVREVVLAHRQFSAFDDEYGGVISGPRKALENSDPYIAVAAYLAQKGESAQKLFDEFLEICSGVIWRPDAENPWVNGQIDDERAGDVRHYFSPVSMRPPGRTPPWYDAAHEVLVPDVATERFRFFARIP